MVLGKRKRMAKPFKKRTKVRRNPTNRIAKVVNNKYQKYFFTRKCVVGEVASQQTLNTQRNLTFSLNQLPNYSEFTNLFDKYRIHAIKLTFYPRYSGNDLNPVVTPYPIIPKIYSIIDYDDSNNLGSINEALEHPHCKIRLMTKQFSIYLKPRVLSEVYRSAISTSYSSKKCYVDMAQPDTPHYGVKMILDSTGSTAVVTMDIVAKYYFSCMNVR